MKKAALILEGGALRNQFTAGVLDAMMEHNLYFSYVNGVSAGSLAALSYISQQPGRTHQVNMEYCQDKRYMSIQNYLKTGSYFGFNFMFQTVANQMIPFDFDTFYQSDILFEAVATNVKTAQAHYFSKDNYSNIMNATTASASMPILSPIVYLDDEPYLDGGVTMPVAYQRAIDLGYDKIVVIKTRDRNYRKSKLKKPIKKAYQKMYKNYPEFVKKLCQVPEQYNTMQKEIYQLKKEGHLFIIDPKKPITISRVEKDLKKLEDLYYYGKRTLDYCYDELIEYLDDKGE